MITNKDNIVVYDTDGTTDVFPITFQFWANTDIVAKLRNNTTLIETELVLTTDFTLSGGNGLVGNLTTTSVYPSGSKLLIQRETSRQQTVDLTSTDDFNAESVEAQLDKTVAMVQEVANASALIVKGSPFDEGDIDFTLPSPSAGKVLKWNATENGFVNSTNNPDEQVALAAAQAVIATTQASNASTSASAAQTAKGLAEDARDEAQAYAESIDPDNFLDKTDDKASQEQAEAGEDDATYMTPLKTKQAIASLAGYGTWANSTSDYTDNLATTDLLVSAYITCNAQSSVEGRTDENTTPTTVVAKGFGDANNAGASITFPVKKGNYWSVVPSGHLAITVYVLSVGQ